MKNICPGCGVELKFMNTPNFGGGKLSDGNQVCRSCFKILANQDVSFGLKSKENYDSQKITEIINPKSYNKIFPERPIPSSNKKEIKVPIEFEDEIFAKENDLDYNIVDTIVLIDYQDAKGNISSRRITIKSIENSNDDFLIKAFCHERKASRSFKSSRIREIIDIETGEVFENPSEFLLSKLDLSNVNEITKWMNEMRHELLLMTYMAKSDGYFHPNERNLILEFIIKEYNKSFDHQMIDSEIRRFHCDCETFRNSLKIVAKKNREFKAKIFRIIECVVNSDGNIDPVEKGILELIKQKFN